MNQDRRSFIFSIAALAAAPPRFLLPPAGSGQPDDPAGLSAKDVQLLGRFCEQLIPADEDPGANDLGVPDFIVRVLREAHPEWTEVYRSGLASAEASSRSLYGASFVELSGDQQIELMQKMERGELPPGAWTAPQPADFFSMVRSHAMQGCYSHPTWGGNRGKAAWKMIGFDDWWV